MRKHRKLLKCFIVLLLGISVFSLWRWHQPEARLRRQIAAFERDFTESDLSVDDHLIALESIAANASENVAAAIIVAERKDSGQTFRAQVYTNLPPSMQRFLSPPLDLQMEDFALEQALFRKADAPLVASLMRHKESSIRLIATKAMVRDSRENGRMPLNTFYPELGNPDPLVQNAVLISIIQAGTKAGDVSQRVIKLLENEDESTRYNAALALMSMGGSTNLATTALESLTNSKSPVLRYHVALMLSNPPPKLNPWVRIYKVNGFKVVPPPPLAGENGLFTSQFVH